MDNLDSKDKEAYAELMRNLPNVNEPEDPDLKAAFESAEKIQELISTNTEHAT